MRVGLEMGGGAFSSDSDTSFLHRSRSCSHGKCKIQVGALEPGMGGPLSGRPSVHKHPQLPSGPVHPRRSYILVG